MLKQFNTVKNIEFYYIERELEGHIFSFGRIGAGKSVSTKSIIEGYHDNKGYKVFDLYGGERSEHLFWSIPNQDKEYWEKLSLLGSFDENGPKQYKVNLLYPLFMSKLPKELPKKEPHVTSHLFTLPIKDITVEDLKMVLGNLAGTNIAGWEEILINLKRNDNCGALDYLSQKGKLSNSSLYKEFIVPMEREGFLMDEYNDTNLDLIREARNKEVISVLCLEFVPPRFRLFVLNYFIRKLTELVDKGKIHNRNLLFIREASYFFKATEDSIMEERFKIFRSKMIDYLRMGRRGTYFVLDCQSPFEVKGMVQGCLSEDTKIFVNKNNKNYIQTIKKLDEKFNVISYDINTKGIKINLAKKIFSGNRECYEIEFENGEKVVATEEHKFFNKNKKEIKVSELKVGDKLLFINNVI